MMVLDVAAQLNLMTVRFACLCHDLGTGSDPTDVLPATLTMKQPAPAGGVRTLAGCRWTAGNWPTWCSAGNTAISAAEFSPPPWIAPAGACDAQTGPLAGSCFRL
jgi:hypothetical protein